MKAIYLAAFPYAKDVLNLPVESVEKSIPYYQNVFGLELVSTEDTPIKRAVLARDSIQLGIAENGGDSSQEGAAIRVNNLEAAWNELKANGLDQDAPKYGDDIRNEKKYRNFFVIAPDGLCYCFNEELA